MKPARRSKTALKTLLGYTAERQGIAECLDLGEVRTRHTVLVSPFRFAERFQSICLSPLPSVL